MNFGTMLQTMRTIRLEMKDFGGIAHEVQKSLFNRIATIPDEFKWQNI